MKDRAESIIVVSGLPRSGTSMMMQILEAGGIPILKDEVRQADEDNPKGYYECERVKRSKEDLSWVEEAKGKAVKVISALLYYLPPRWSYRLIFMQRPMAEILASQRVMLERRGQRESLKIDDKIMAERFSHHLQEVESWLARQPHIEAIFVHYPEVIADPANQVKAIAEFLGGELDVERMIAAVDRDLYRKRFA